MVHTPVLLPSLSLPLGTFVVGPTAAGQRYQGDALIAEGGMGAVYRGHALATNNPPVAIKLALGNLGPQVLARFQREIATVIGLDHPHIVRTLDHGRDERFGPFIVMELLEGETLEDLLARRPLGRLEPGYAAEIAGPVCSALLYAHTREAPLIHRDIKPANVFLARKTGGTVVKVMDFGLARDPNAESGGIGPRQKLTEAGMALGTLQFFAPEQCRGKPVLASDVYALGIMLYLMLEGRFPFPDHLKTPEEYVAWHLQGLPRAMTCPSPALRNLVFGMIEKDARKRPRLEAVADALRPFTAAPVASADDASLTVRAAIPAPVAHETPTARMTKPAAAVPEEVPAAQAVTVRAPSPVFREPSSPMHAIEDDVYWSPPPPSPTPAPRAVSGEISDKIVVDRRPPPGRIGRLFRRFARVLSRRE